jgi:hypothetical protein
MVKEAQEAYVVSPVSSLIVLESSEEYKRFGISDAAISLKNAAATSKGAVPEPQEWVLILLVLLFLGVISSRRREISTNALQGPKPRLRGEG